MPAKFCCRRLIELTVLGQNAVGNEQLPHGIDRQIIRFGIGLLEIFYRFLVGSKVRVRLNRVMVFKAPAFGGDEIVELIRMFPPLSSRTSIVSFVTCTAATPKVSIDRGVNCTVMSSSLPATTRKYSGVLMVARPLTSLALPRRKIACSGPSKNAYATSLLGSDGCGCTNVPEPLLKLPVTFRLPLKVSALVAKSP